MRDIRITVDLAYPPAAVWRALTDREALGEWLMENDFRPEVGHAFTFRTDPAPGFDGVVHARVLTLEAERELKLSWRGGGLDTIVTFTLEPTATGTRLTLVHAGFGARNLVQRIVLGFGWRGLVRRKLPGVLAAQREVRA